MSLYVSKKKCRPGVLLLNAEKHFLKCTNSRLGRTCTLHVCLLYALQAKSASIDVTKGVGRVSPPNIFIYFLNINRDKQLQKNCFIVRKHILLCLKEKKFYFQVTLTERATEKCCKSAKQHVMPFALPKSLKG